MSFHSLITPKTRNGDVGQKTALLLDDCEFDRQRIKRLNSKLEVPLLLEEVPDIDAMNNCLDAQAFDLIMIDYGLGKDDGLSALDMIQKHKQNQDAAKIMISGNTQASIAVTALKRGCSDYVSKKELTPELFQKSVYDALKKARPDRIDTSKSVEVAIKEALLEGDLRDILRDAVSRAVRDNGTVPLSDNWSDYDPNSLQSLLLNLVDEDDFIFK